LVGRRVPPPAPRDLRRFVEALGYRHWDESDNPAYRLFLR
jgi:threonine dehydratase